MALSLRGIFEQMTAWPSGATHVTPLTSTVYLGHESRHTAALRPISADSYYSTRNDPQSDDPALRAFAAMDAAQQMKTLKPMTYDDLQAQNDLPPGIANLFREFGVSTNIARRMTAINERAEDIAARGYDGGTLSTACAHFNPASMAINFSQQTEVEKDGQRGDPGARHYKDHKRDPYGIYWHEAGHGIDRIMGLFSDNDPAFKNAVEAGLVRIRADMEVNGAKKYDHIRYFMTKDMGGLQETAAAVRSEIFAELYSEQNVPGKRAHLGKLFPEAAAIVRERAAQLEEECRAFPGFRGGSEAMQQEILMDMISEMFGSPDTDVPGAAVRTSLHGQRVLSGNRG